MTGWWIAFLVLAALWVALEVFAKFFAPRLPGKVGRCARRLRDARRGL